MHRMAQDAGTIIQTCVRLLMDDPLPDAPGNAAAFLIGSFYHYKKVDLLPYSERC